MILLLLSGTTVFLIAGIIFFAARRPGYSHIRNTISELGEDNAPGADVVNMRLFLPAGVVLIWIGIAGWNRMNGWELALCIGAGYTLSALFPCDPGAPLIGGFRQMMHNLAGLIEYGGGIYFLYKAKHLLFSTGPVSSGLIVSVMTICAVLAPLPVFRWRGLLQRIMELILFGQLLWLSCHSGL
ncbi:MAG: DUF998 domain-containing protein [Chitinophagaceae bacterium]|nr:DUF998 domain-containing protein [Chitinophagaceae bacterium]